MIYKETHSLSTFSFSNKKTLSLPFTSLHLLLFLHFVTKFVPISEKYEILLEKYRKRKSPKPFGWFRTRLAKGVLRRRVG